MLVRSSLLGTILCLSVLAPGMAGAQGTSTVWEIELHGGVLLSSQPSSGTARLPEASLFAASSGRTSRRVASWFFGAGADLLSQVAVQLGAGPGVTPLDDLLTRPLAERRTGGLVGFRLSRALTPRLALELSVDYAIAPLEISAQTAAAIDESRSTFLSTWSGVIETGPFSNAAVNSTQTVRAGEGREVVTTGTLNLNLRTEGSVIPYLAVGAGVVSRTGRLPEAMLEGGYAFDVSSAWRASETDRIRLRPNVADQAFVGVVGGGAKLMMSPRWGLRLDVRVHLADQRIGTLLDANPDVVTSTPSGQLSSVTSPSLQLSNNEATGFASSLSGPEITRFATFDASGGLRPRLGVSGGLLWRF